MPHKLLQPPGKLAGPEEEPSCPDDQLGEKGKMEAKRPSVPRQAEGGLSRWNLAGG